MDDEMLDAMLKEVCITEQTQYYFASSQVTFRGNIDCENCTRYKKKSKEEKKKTCSFTDAVIHLHVQDTNEVPDEELMKSHMP